jgi:hypothetical protein
MKTMLLNNGYRTQLPGKKAFSRVFPNWAAIQIFLSKLLAEEKN